MIPNISKQTLQIISLKIEVVHKENPVSEKIFTDNQKRRLS